MVASLKIKKSLGPTLRSANKKRQEQNSQDQGQQADMTFINCFSLGIDL